MSSDSASSNSVSSGTASSGNKMSGAGSGGGSPKPQVVSERSKTIKNDKTKTTVTYTVKKMSDGSLDRSKIEKSVP